MNVHPIHRAVTQGTKTVPIDKPRTKKIRSDSRIFPDEIALAVEMARTDRIERDIASYAIRKRTA